MFHLTRLLTREHLVLSAFPLSLAHMWSLLLAAEEGPPVRWQSLAKILVCLGLCVIFEEMMGSVVWKLTDLWKDRKIRRSSHLYSACLKRHAMIPMGISQSHIIPWRHCPAIKLHFIKCL